MAHDLQESSHRDGNHADLPPRRQLQRQHSGYRDEDEVKVCDEAEDPLRDAVILQPVASFRTEGHLKPRGTLGRGAQREKRRHDAGAIGACGDGDAYSDEPFQPAQPAEAAQVEEEEREFDEEDDGAVEGDVDDLEGEAFVGVIADGGVPDVFAAAGFAFSGNDAAGVGDEARLGVEVSGRFEGRHEVSYATNAVTHVPIHAVSRKLRFDNGTGRTIIPTS